MSMATNRRTAAQEILLAAADLANTGKRDFTEWELTVAAWRRDNNRFGLRGFESAHPDHKRVMMEIMGQTKKDNPVRRCFIVKTKPNYYRLTDLGAAEVTALLHRPAVGATTSKSPGLIYVAVEPFVESPPFRAWLKDNDEPRTWLGAAAFLGLSRNTANELNDRIRAIETAAKHASEWCVQAGRNDITRGVHGGSRPIPLAEIEQLQAFLDVLRGRFARQIEAIRQKEG
ncbi:MAG: hypothetical protein SGJ20_02270 [Planctomycetota bacterium]|nr:hypothetical protein [Planctomycetota bacterium]